MQYFPVPHQQQRGQIYSQEGQLFLVTRLPSGHLQYEPIPQNPQGYPQTQSHDPTAMAMAVAAIALLSVLAVGGICYAVGYNAGERSAARVLVCDRQEARTWFSDNSTVNCR